MALASGFRQVTRGQWYSIHKPESTQAEINSCVEACSRYLYCTDEASNAEMVAMDVFHLILFRLANAILFSAARQRTPDHANMIVWGGMEAGFILFGALIVRVPNLKSRCFFEALAPLVQHRFFYTSMFIRVKEARICLLARKQPRRS